jgi:hypothetical protein
MKVRWGMIIPIHSNEDSEEFADGGHIGVLSIFVGKKSCSNRCIRMVAQRKISTVMIANHLRPWRIGNSNHPSGPSLPTTPVRLTGLMLSPSLGAAWFAWQIGPPVGFCAEPRPLPGRQISRAAHKPPTLPRARSGTSGPLPAPSPGNGIATHRPVHSSLDCTGGPRAPSGSSL